MRTQYFKMFRAVGVLFLMMANAPLYASDLSQFKPQQNYNLAQIDVGSLGFSETQIKPDIEMQKTLELRSSMLQQHQFWGLAALAGMGLSLLSGGEGDLPPEHPWVSGITLGLYSVSAYYALMAPERTMGPGKGQIEWHKWLAWVHLPGMILAPIAGYMAAKKFDNNEKLDGLSKQHKNIAGATAVAFALSVISVTFEF
jgi:hypothetical protein